MPNFAANESDALVKYLQDNGIVIYADRDELIDFPMATGTNHGLPRAVNVNYPGGEQHVEPHVWYVPSDVSVTRDHLEALTQAITDDPDDPELDADQRWRGLFWRHTTRTYTRSFVVLDFSDFSKMEPEEQLLAVAALVRLGREIDSKIGESEATLCRGDGYVYVYRKPDLALHFAALLAYRIEREVAARRIPDTHFRIGVHCGPVRYFWDPGRKDYNYIGHGINDASRVLDAIGKDLDDVVYLSGDLRQPLIITNEHIVFNIRSHLTNRGRHRDKHGKLHRVYQFDHDAYLEERGDYDPQKQLGKVPR